MPYDFTYYGIENKQNKTKRKKRKQRLIRTDEKHLVARGERIGGIWKLGGKDKEVATSCYEINKLPINTVKVQAFIKFIEIYYFHIMWAFFFFSNFTNFYDFMFKKIAIQFWRMPVSFNNFSKFNRIFSSATILILCW